MKNRLQTRSRSVVVLSLLSKPRSRRKVSLHVTSPTVETVIASWRLDGFLFFISISHLFHCPGCKVASSSREEEEHDVSDSASSSFNVAVKEPSAAPPPSFGGSPTTLRREAEYVRAVLLKADVDSPSPLNPLLYDQLEKEEQKEKLNKVGTLRRKALFDCVGEFLDSRRRRHLSAGYRAWAKGATAVAGGVDRLAEAAHRELLRWEGMVDFMVEDLVEKDMAPWVDFEAEYFETGVDVEEQILSSIVDDVLDDVLAVYHRQLQ